MAKYKYQVQDMPEEKEAPPPPPPAMVHVVLGCWFDGNAPGTELGVEPAEAERLLSMGLAKLA